MVIADCDDRYENVRHKKGGKVEAGDLFAILDSLEEQTLIYCSSPSSARKLAFLYCAHLISKITEDKAIDIISAHREDIRPYLSVYEMEILDRAF